MPLGMREEIIHMAKNKENKIVINNSAKLFYNGVEITADNVKDVPTSVLAKFFVAHLAKNYPFGDSVWEVGKELKTRIEDSESAKEVSVELAGLATSDEADKIVNMLNPLDESGARTYSGGYGVEEASDLANAGKLLYSVDLISVQLINERLNNATSQEEIKALNEKVAELTKDLQEREKELDHLKTTRLEVGKQNKKKKTSKIVMIGAVVLLGVALATSLGFNIGQKAKTDRLEAENSSYVLILDEVERIAKENGYKNGMKDENGNYISAVQFIEGKMKEDAEGLKQQIAEMKETIRNLGYEVDDSQTLAGIVKNVYDAFQTEKANAVSTEVMGAYLHFANLLDDLGIQPEDIVDENGNLDVSKFDGKVADVVETSLKNAEHLRLVQEKIDTTFEALKIYKTDENGNVVKDASGNPVVKKAVDCGTFDRAIDEIESAYQEKEDAYKKSIVSALDIAFAKANIQKEFGTGIYSMDDFEGDAESAIAFLGDKAGTLSAEVNNYVSLLEQKQLLIDELQDKVDSLQDDLDAVNDEKRDLEDQIDDLKKKLSEQDKENKGQEGSETENEGENVGPVAGEEKDDSNNSGSDRPGSKEDGGSGSQFDEDEFNK